MSVSCPRLTMRSSRPRNRFFALAVAWLAVAAKRGVRQHVSHLTLATLAVVLIAYPFDLVSANSGIPGPLIWFGGAQTTDPWRWVVACMFMCIFVEGAIYKYWRLFNKPFWVSAYVNTISLVLGIPISLLGAIDPTWVVIPTIASTLIEAFFARRLPRILRQRGLWKTRRGVFYWRVFVANLVSNAIMFGYLYVSYRKAVA